MELLSHYYDDDGQHAHLHAKAKGGSEEKEKRGQDSRAIDCDVVRIVDGKMERAYHSTIDY